MCSKKFHGFWSAFSLLLAFSWACSFSAAAQTAQLSSATTSSSAISKMSLNGLLVSSVASSATLVERLLERKQQQQALQLTIHGLSMQIAGLQLDSQTQGQDLQEQKGKVTSLNKELTATSSSLDSAISTRSLLETQLSDLRTQTDKVVADSRREVNLWRTLAFTIAGAFGGSLVKGPVGAAAGAGIGLAAGGAFWLLRL